MKTFKEHIEETEIEEGYSIDTSPWQLSHKGQTPKEKGTWAFDITASIAANGMASLENDTFFSKAMSSYKDAVKQLSKYLKKNLRAKPKDVKIKLVP